MNGQYRRRRVAAKTFRMAMERLEDRLLLSVDAGLDRTNLAEAALVQSTPWAETAPGSTLPDALRLPDSVRAEFQQLAAASPVASPSGQIPYGAAAEDTSEFMLGDVWVTVVLFESDGSIDTQTENWTSTQIAQVKSEVEQGATWWETTLANTGSSASLNFQFDFQYADNPIATGYEPINRNSWHEENLWIDDFLTQVGYRTAADYRADLLNWNNDQRIAHNTDWAYTICVVNSATDANGMFPDSYFGYAWFGGPHVMMTYDNDGWGIDRMEMVTAHETGHIFWALDEYPGAASYTDHSGYYNTQNLNASDGNPSPSSRVASIMAESDLQLTAYPNHISSPTSRQMLGWKDSDSDGTFDVLDIPLTLSGQGTYNASTGQYEFSGTSFVETLPNQSPMYSWSSQHPDTTINTVDRIQFRINGGNWDRRECLRRLLGQRGSERPGSGRGKRHGRVSHDL